MKKFDKKEIFEGISESFGQEESGIGSKAQKETPIFFGKENWKVGTSNVGILIVPIAPQTSNVLIYVFKCL